MDDYQIIPELHALRVSSSFIRIPPGVDVPVTARIRKLIDSKPFQRLQSISQLGLVALVYPGARHSRFEHSLGVYRNALLFLERLTQIQDFRDRCTPQQSVVFLVAALLHDIGHSPYAHAIEDMQLQGYDRHEILAEQFLYGDELRKILEIDFDVSPDQVFALLNPKHPKSIASGHNNALLSSMLSGPIDIDKLDYLDRDSMNAGVPYGRNFDQPRLINQLCVDTEQNRLAITQKGTTAAEMMVFARYIMFSEVYWHHTVRAATAMLQHGVYRMPNRDELLQRSKQLGDIQFQMELLAASANSVSSPLIQGLFSNERRLMKRAMQYDVLTNEKVHGCLARRSFDELVRLSESVAEELTRLCNFKVLSTDLIVDAPPAKLEVQFDVRVRQVDGTYRPLGDFSPVVKTLATQQFDSIVKRVRVFTTDSIKRQSSPALVERVLQQVLSNEA